ncbi:exported hypothetical protein [Paraburkholderia ribeironis]|uniref:Uncharacterized protein n=1 Tax=Paraburkholderia ribeironis TaxID=1247936 RepID=A0A1N7SAT4_9BURK|nr:exported hypothetical protein [Paraburkholderia ribeironis]
MLRKRNRSVPTRLLFLCPMYAFCYITWQLLAKLDTQGSQPYINIRLVQKIRNPWRSFDEKVASRSRSTGRICRRRTCSEQCDPVRYR